MASRSLPIPDSAIGARQRGAVLVIALIFLVIMTLIGVSAMQTTLLEERMAGNMRDEHVAFEASEGALRAGECGLENNATFVDLDFDGSDGSYDFADGNTPDPLSQPLDPTSDNLLQLAGLPNTNQAPLYFIERLPSPPPLTQGPVKEYYRVVSSHTGNSSNASVVLQTTYVPNAAQPNC